MTRNNLFKKYLNPFFVETGSYIGDGIQEALDANFNEIYSIELSDKYFDISCERFRNNKKVHIIKGDSSILLYDLIKDINQNITFWLDGHCSEGDTAKGVYYTPLIQELDQIKKHQINTHTIIIDDMRLWDEKDDKIGFGKDKIIEKILEINPNYKIVYENGYADNDILVATYPPLEIGLTYQNYPVVSIGDTLCLTPIIEAISKERNELTTVCTPLPELFFNNPYVKDITQNQNPNINLQPCVSHGCNAIELYAKQMNLKLPKRSKPKIYLSNDEIEYGKNALAEFEGYKKIAVSLESSTEVKDLKYNYLSPLLNRLKRNGYKLIGVGKEKIPKHYDYDKTFINKTSLREVCAIINECDLYLGVDAGLYHISAALDVPQVVFFKNNRASINSYSDTHYIDSKIECKGNCLTPHITKCYNSVRCMDSFDLNEYYNLIVRVLPIISFRIMTKDDLEFFTEVRNSCAEEYLHNSRKFSLDEAKEWFKNFKDIYYIIEYYNNKIGYFRTSNYSHTNRNIYIGCDLYENWRGRGLSYIAYRKFITFLFETQKLHKISLEVLSSNIRAIELYRKLGFVEEGRKREDIKKGQVYVDSIIMSILKKEWKERTNIEKKVCYVVNFYLGNRRYNINTAMADRFCYLKSQIDALAKYKHSLSKIVFTFNVEPEHYSLLSEAIKLIPPKLQNTNVEINIRENIGMSYGAFSDIFRKNMDAYDYYIFNEDDYVIVQNNFDEYLVNKFESLPNCGYLCGLVREIAHFEKNRHAGMSSGISSYKILKEVYEKYNELPHSKGKDYTSNEKQGQTIQTVAIRDLGYEIYDIREEYRMRFWSGDELNPEGPIGRVNIHFMWKNEDLFLPVNLYLGESYNWVDRIEKEFLRMECDYNSSKYHLYQ
jgi:RimJ/RimL family protein N-acetyltransferase